MIFEKNFIYCEGYNTMPSLESYCKRMILNVAKNGLCKYHQHDPTLCGDDEVVARGTP